MTVGLPAAQAVHPAHDRSDKTRAGHRAGFDGLRAMAVSLVWLSHLDAARFYNGVRGVDIFFVLSGYLITGVLAQEYQKAGTFSLSRFYLRRFLRLTPALWLLLAASLCFYLLEPRVRPGLLGAIIASATYSMNYNRIFASVGESYLGHTWSLAIEEQFYLFWPITIAFLPRRFWLRAAILLFVGTTAWKLWLAIHVGSYEWVYNSFECRMDLMLLGSILSLTGHAVLPVIPPALRILWPVATLALVAIVLGPKQSEAATAAIAMSLVGLCTGVIILAIEHHVLAGALVYRPIVQLGRISYGVYLWHYPILYVLALYGFRDAWALLDIPLTLAVALFSFRWVEQPLLRLKTRLETTTGRFNVDA